MPSPWPQPPPRNTTSPGAVAAGIAAPPEAGQSAAWAAPGPRTRAPGRRARGRAPAGRARRSTPGSAGAGGAGGTSAPHHCRCTTRRRPSSGANWSILGAQTGRERRPRGRSRVGRDAPPVLRHLRRCDAPPGRGPARRVCASAARPYRSATPPSACPPRPASPMLRQPWTLPLLAWRLLRCWSSLVVRSAGAAGRRWPDAVVVGYLGHFDVLLARRLFPHVPIVLDHLIGASDTATDRGVSRRPAAAAAARASTRPRWAAPTWSSWTPTSTPALPERTAGGAVVVPVGRTAVLVRRARRRPRRGRGPLRAVFFGLFTPLQGAPVIGAALAALAGDAGRGHHGRLRPGPRRDPRAGRRQRRGVRWRRLGRRPPSCPPWSPRTTSASASSAPAPKAPRVVPNKVFQGAAAGCAIVTSDTAPQRRVLGDAALLVPPGDPAALATALRALAADPALLARGPRRRAPSWPAPASPRPPSTARSARTPARRRTPEDPP